MTIKSKITKYKKKLWPYTVFVGLLNLIGFLSLEVIPYIIYMILEISGADYEHESLQAHDYIAMGLLLCCIWLLLRVLYKKIKNNDLSDTSLDDLDI